eukprot:5589803-Prymnesium_polylepis.1
MVVCTRAPRARTDQLSGWNEPLRSTAGGRGPPVHSPSRRSHLAPCAFPSLPSHLPSSSLPVPSRSTADQ